MRDWRDERDVVHLGHQNSIKSNYPGHPTSRLARFPVSLIIALCAFVAFLAFVDFPAHSAGPPSDLIAEVQKKYDQTHSLSADFLQKTRSRAASMGTSARGRLFFLKPRAIRWDYAQPRQQFVINEDKAWLYVPEEKTIYLYDAEQIINSPVVLSFFSGLGQLGEMFSITQLPPESGPPPRHRLLLLPREAESPVSQIILWIDPHSHHVVGIQTEDPLGNINEITFTNIQVNAPLEPSWFALKVPEGVRLERQEGLPTE
ncbi:MAG: outer membrane lipoprotein carrier protein LolA [Deltaproteobacteria bacterium]|nr:MAG: outer membrane lipoprotein carrier protein LolA [Deltaproteobacteria bacterium]